MQALALALLIGLAGCTTVLETAVEPDDFASLAEAYCKAHPELPCGHVYMCETAAENELGLVELCVPHFIDVTVVERLYGACVPTPRHSGQCWWCCGAGCTAGCNALTSCFCPVSPPPD